MKKLLLIILLAMIMVGCEEKNEDREYATDERGYTYGVTVIDSCEYYHGTYMLTHKGNCKYCLERNRKMVKEQIDTALIEIFD